MHATIRRRTALPVAFGFVLCAGCASAPSPDTAAVAEPATTGVQSASELPEVAPAPAPQVARMPEPEPAPDREQLVRDAGWSWLVEKLVADGLPRERVLEAFSDPRFDAFDGLTFSIDPRESKALYRHVLTRRNIRAAQRCLDENAVALVSAEQAHGVPPTLVAAILQVETACGRNTGDSPILYRLARLAMANEPANLEWNVQRNATRKGKLDAELVARTRVRGQYLEDIFYPEVRATFVVADRMGVDPLSLTGSPSGAFGYPQFLPTSYLRHGADGNGDGKVSLYEADDAAHSAARYLSAHGWKEGISKAERRKVIWHYNRSDAYIDAVLGLASRLDATRAREVAREAAGRTLAREASDESEEVSAGAELPGG